MQDPSYSTELATDVETQLATEASQLL